MILNNDKSHAISTLGWVDKGFLWQYSLGQASPRCFAISDAKYLILHAGEDDLFAVVHHWEGSRLEITAHPYSNPQQTLSRLSLQRVIPHLSSKVELSCEGDIHVWERLPAAYTGYAFGDYQLIMPHAGLEQEVQTFAWFDDSYDKGYQGIVGVMEIPGSPLLIISIQRDSHPVLYDPVTQTAVRKLNLADRRGNPLFQGRPTAHELWATDYDAIVKLDAKSLDVKASKLLQQATSGTGQFIGEFCLDPSQSRCLVARPYSSDILILDANSLVETSRIKLGRQPLDLAMMADGTIIARDWKTGDFLFHRLRP